MSKNKNKEFKARNREMILKTGTLLEDIDLSIVEEGPYDNYYDPWGLLPQYAAEEDAVHSQKLFEMGLEKRHLISDQIKMPLYSITGKGVLPNRLLCSNMQIRVQASRVMIDVVSNHWKDSKSFPDRQWWFMSIIGDSGNMLEYSPEMDLAAFQKAVISIVTQSGLHGIGVTEFQVLTNFPQKGYGRSFMANSHVICWTDDLNFDAETVERGLRASPLLTHWLGAKTVQIDPMPTPTHRYLIWRAHYMLKAPIDGKYLARSEDTPSGWALKSTGIRYDIMFRLTELLSQLEFPEMVFAVGEGRILRKKWLKKLQDWHLSHSSRFALIGQDEVREIWPKLWEMSRCSIARLPFNLSAKIQGLSPWEKAALEVSEEKSATKRYSKRNKSQ